MPITSGAQSARRLTLLKKPNACWTSRPRCFSGAGPFEIDTNLVLTEKKPMKTSVSLFWLTVSVSLLGFKSVPSSSDVPNFSILDTNIGVYRGAEPSAAGWQYLASLGVSRSEERRVGKEGRS